MIIDPGHFHAALSLKEPHRDISSEVFVYAPEGPELDQFLSIVNSFNVRQVNPTQWNLQVYKGKDFLEASTREKKGDIAIIAGKNNTKMDTIQRLHEAGFHILADKPLIISNSKLELLFNTLHKPSPLLMDIMTGRHELTNILRKELLHNPNIFGKIQPSIFGEASVYIESIHHLYKIVNSKPLLRPSWFFDTSVQGEGTVDIPTHLVDLAHWTLFPVEKIDIHKDISLEMANAWPTSVPLAVYKRITNQKHFPSHLSSHVEADNLNFRCNAEIKYTVKGLPVHIKSVWNLEIPEGGGDTYYSIFRGTLSNLVIRQLPRKSYRLELLIEPKNKNKHNLIHKELVNVFEKWEQSYPGIISYEEGTNIIIDIPETLHLTHEEHFSQVFKQFIGFVNAEKLPEEEGTNMFTKYALLVAAKKMTESSNH